MVRKESPLTLLQEGWLCEKPCWSRDELQRLPHVGSELSNRRWNTRSTHCPHLVVSQFQGTPNVRQGSWWELHIQAMNKPKLEAKLSCSTFPLPCIFSLWDPYKNVEAVLPAWWKWWDISSHATSWWTFPWASQKTEGWLYGWGCREVFPPGQDLPVIQAGQMPSLGTGCLPQCWVGGTICEGRKVIKWASFLLAWPSQASYCFLQDCHRMWRCPGSAAVGDVDTCPTGSSLRQWNLLHTYVLCWWLCWKQLTQLRQFWCPLAPASSPLPSLMSDSCRRLHILPQGQN